MLGRELREDAVVLAHIKHFFTMRSRPMPAGVGTQALVPQGALVLPNPHGTAPGLAIEVRPNPFRAGGQASWLILLPGPPRELRPMFMESVLPLLKRALPAESAFVCHTLRSTGVGESVVEERIAEPLRPLASRSAIALVRARSMCASPRAVSTQRKSSVMPWPSFAAKSRPIFSAATTMNSRR
jgi:nicotinamide-nucleotide amidase